jgi:hypothetical protein
MPSFLPKIRRRPRNERPVQDDRDLVAFVNEARTDAQRERVLRSARRRAGGRR